MPYFISKLDKKSDNQAAARHNPHILTCLIENGSRKEPQHTPSRKGSVEGSLNKQLQGYPSVDEVFSGVKPDDKDLKGIRAIEQPPAQAASTSAEREACLISYSARRWYDQPNDKEPWSSQCRRAKS